MEWGCEEQTKDNNRRDSFLMEGLGSETASYKQFKIIGIASDVRDKIVFSRSSIAIW